MKGLQLGLLLFAFGFTYAQNPTQTSSSCLQIMASGAEENQDKMLLCQLLESSSLMAQLGALVSEGLTRLAAVQGIVVDGAQEEVGQVEKRKHEYLRFGKRKHEYLRFGKRKHEYLRFGRK